MKKLFSILAITALVFAGTLSSKAANVQIMPSNVQTVMAAATVSIIQDEEGNEVEYEIILTFTNPDTDIKYVVYKELGDTDDVLAARYEESSDHDGSLSEIETEEEN